MYLIFYLVWYCKRGKNTGLVQMGKSVAKVVLSTGVQGRRGHVCAGLPRWPLSWSVFRQMAAAEQLSPALLSIWCLCSSIQINTFCNCRIVLQGVHLCTSSIGHFPPVFCSKIWQNKNILTWSFILKIDSTDACFGSRAWAKETFISRACPSVWRRQELLQQVPLMGWGQAVLVGRTDILQGPLSWTCILLYFGCICFLEGNRKCMLHLVPLPCPEFPHSNRSCPRTGWILGNYWGLAVVNQGCPHNMFLSLGKSRAELCLDVLGDNLFFSVHTYERGLGEYLA